jgi:hypothetical protein
MGLPVTGLPSLAARMRLCKLMPHGMVFRRFFDATFRAFAAICRSAGYLGLQPPEVRMNVPHIPRALATENALWTVKIHWDKRIDTDCLVAIRIVRH